MRSRNKSKEVFTSMICTEMMLWLRHCLVYVDLVVMMQGDHERFGKLRSAADTTLNYHISNHLNRI